MRISLLVATLLADALARPAVSMLGFSAERCDVRDDPQQPVSCPPFGLRLGRHLARASLALDDAKPVRRLRGGATETPATLTDFKSWWASKSKSLKMPATIATRKDPDREKAAALMKQRGLDKCEKAVALLRQANKRDPDDVATAMELADALNAVMRIKTNANALVIDGSLDTTSNKRVWKTLGDEALPLAKQAYQARPGDVKALAVYADAFMFSCSAKGIVKQALSGTAKEYKRVANELRKYPKWDGAVGLIFLGGLYNVAPWPVGNKQLAKKLLSEVS